MSDLPPLVFHNPSPKAVSTFLLIGFGVCTIAAAIGAIKVRGRTRSQIQEAIRKDQAAFEELQQRQERALQGVQGPQGLQGAQPNVPQMDIRQLQQILLRYLSEAESSRIYKGYDQALRLAQEAYKVSEALQSEERIAQTASYLVNTLYKAGYVNESQQQCMAVLDLHQNSPVINFALRTILIDIQMFDQNAPHIEQFIQQTLEMMVEFYDQTSDQVVATLVRYATFKSKCGYLDAALKLLDQTLEIVATKKPNVRLAENRELLKIYYEKQRALIATGRVEPAKEIQKKVDELCGDVLKTDMPYYWHLFHIATALVDSGYENFAEHYYNTIINRFKIPFNELMQSKREKRPLDEDGKKIISLVGNSLNELSAMIYAQGRHKLAAELAEEVNHSTLVFSTSTRYLETSFVNPVPRGEKILLRGEFLLKPYPVQYEENTTMKIKIMNIEGEDLSVMPELPLDISKPAFVLESKEFTPVKGDMYTIYIDLWGPRASFDSEIVYLGTHIQRAFSPL